MKISKALLMLIALLCLQGCGGLFSNSDRKIKSPCVRMSGTKDCERHPINKDLTNEQLLTK